MNQVNWAEIIEHVCMQVIRRHREGEPVVQVKDIPKPEGIKWRLEPVLIEGAPTLVYGYGESGKSYLAAIWATIIAEGYPMDGLKPKPGNVLYLDWENTGRENARRFDAIHKGLGLARRSEVHYRSCSQRLSSDIQEIQKVVLEKGIDVVVVDTAGPACGGDPESAQSSIQFLMALRSLNKTTLVLAHKAKSKETTGPFGSVYWSNYPRNVFNLRADPREGDSTLPMALIHEKSNEGRRQKPLGLSLEFTDDGDEVSFSTTDLKDIPESESVMTVGDRIASVLSGGKMHVQEITEALDGLSERQVRNGLINSPRRFQSIAGERGVWGLLAEF